LARPSPGVQFIHQLRTSAGSHERIAVIETADATPADRPRSSTWPSTGRSSQGRSTQKLARLVMDRPTLATTPW
jgi:hypothetical protein